jgi:CRP-like cAMP-binding protein
MENDTPASGGNLLLASLPAAAVEVLLPSCDHVVLEPGMVLQTAAEPIRHVYFPRNGLVSVLATLSSGDEINLAAVGRDGGVGITAGLGSDIAPNNAVVRIGGDAMRTDLPSLRRATDASESFRSLIARYVEAFLVEVQQNAACNALHGVEQRLCRWLLQTMDRAGGDIALTHEFLSFILGVRRQTVSVAAGRLQSAGVIRYHWGHIEILDRRHLEANACECYRVIRRHVELVIPEASVPKKVSDQLSK